MPTEPTDTTERTLCSHCDERATVIGRTYTEAPPSTNRVRATGPACERHHNPRLVPGYREALKREARTAALLRGHSYLETVDRGRTQSGWECGLCGMEVTADWNPPANGIDISGEAVALNCPNTQNGAN